MTDLPFNLLLDKYRKELINLGTFSGEQTKWYWKNRSDETYKRLIEMYNEANNSGR